VGDNDFELSIPPFLRLHPVFDVELLRPYFPPLPNTLDMAKHLAPIEINLEFIEHVIVDWIIYTNDEGHSPTKYPTLLGRQGRDNFFTRVSGLP
jgi:hypothetical protein